MFFFLSKTLSYLTQPLLIVCSMLLVSYFSKSARRKKVLNAVAIFSLLFLSNDFIANEIMKLWEIAPTSYKRLESDYDFGILLTGVAKSEAVLDDRVFLNRGADRITHAVQLYRLGIIKKILISGGNGNLKEIKKQEADQIADVLHLMNVPDSVIVIENKSRNTHESASSVRKMWGDKYNPKCLLITSAFHMRRSLACFKHESLNVVPFSTDLSSHLRKYDIDVLLVPKLEAIYNWQIIIKECVGMAAYKLAGYI